MPLCNSTRWDSTSFDFDKMPYMLSYEFYVQFSPVQSFVRAEYLDDFVSLRCPASPFGESRAFLFSHKNTCEKPDLMVDELNF